MSTLCLSFSFLILILSVLSVMADNQSPQPQLFDSQYDSHHISSILDQIQVPSYVSTLYTNKHPTATDHYVVSTISTSMQLCKKLGGEKGAATCSYLLIDRPWKYWRQDATRFIHNAKTQYFPVIYNTIAKAVNYAYVDGLYALQNKVHDWWRFPSLEWYLLKSSLVSLWDQCYYDFWNWYSGKNRTFSNITRLFYGSKKGDDEDQNDGHLEYSHGISDSSEHDLEPDQDGCYYDVLGTALCVDQQRLLDENGLKERVNELFEGMTYEERSHTLRFQQRFIQWATKASSMTAEAMDRAQSLWLQHTNTAYRFLDDALYLDPQTNNNNNKHDDPSQGPTPATRTTRQMTSCPPVVFPFSISPFDTSLDSTFFSLGNQPHSLRSAPPPASSYLPLMPIRQPWTACLSSQNDSTDGNTNNDYHDFGISGKKNMPIYQMPLNPYNKIQHQYLLTRLQKEMMQQLERLEKATLQEYYQAMEATPHQWTLRHNDRHQLHYQRRQLQKLHLYKPAYAAQQLYQELRLYISISLQQLYQRSIQQLMEITEQYDNLAMKQVEHAYDEWKWIKKQQSRRLFTFYPHHDDITNMHHYGRESTAYASPPLSSHTEDMDSSSSLPISDKDAKYESPQQQEQQQPQQHQEQDHQQQQQQQQLQDLGGEVDYDAQCQQCWKRKKPWRLVYLLSSMAEQLGYYHYNKHKDDDNYTLLSTISGSDDNMPVAGGGSMAAESSSSRAVVFIGQRAGRAVQPHRQNVLHQWQTVFQDMDRQSRAIWVSAMDQAQGRHRIWASCNATCTSAIIMAKLLILVLFLFYF
ncbi:hypothetical protein BCR42DRAFT_414355 [Absidia repens]|uniref:Uncharacterized protein n=1 Tax=Absidia repens TaxID=90262 RepID=A0A1X2IIW5_9FUNG|nr:hypothetical protein BCR42DRAFT_414355 [Absidia repens]